MALMNLPRSSTPMARDAEKPPKRKCVTGRVKTGCITCKIRRVKCDEAKPACLRCTSTGRKCDGYAAARKEVFPPASPEPVISLFSELDQPTSRHLEFYFRKAGKALGGELDADFWLRLVPQFGQQEPAIRHCLVAISHLYEANHEKSGTEDFLIPWHADGAFVATHYNKAIRSLRDRMTRDPDSLEIILVACVLFTCLEYMHIKPEGPNAERWFPHVMSGINMLLAAPSRRKPSETHSIARTQSSNDVLMNTIEPLFVRLGTHARFQGHHVGSYTCAATAYEYQVPAVLTDYTHARQVLVEVQNLGIKFVRRATARRKQRAQVPILNPDTFAEAPRDTEEDEAAKAEDFAHQVQLLKLYDEWLQAFDTLDATAVNPPVNTRRWLRMTQAVAHIWITCCTDPSETQYDAHHPLMEHVVSLAEAIFASSPHESTTFSFEMQTVAPIYFVGLRCRHQGTRRRALDILRGIRRREGPWFPQLCATVVARVMELEESDMEVRDDGSLWPSARIRVHDVNYREWTNGMLKMAVHSQPEGPECQGLLWDEWVEVYKGAQGYFLI